MSEAWEAERHASASGYDARWLALVSRACRAGDGPSCIEWFEVVLAAHHHPGWLPPALREPALAEVDAARQAAPAVELEAALPLVAFDASACTSEVDWMCQWKQQAVDFRNAQRLHLRRLSADLFLTIEPRDADDIATGIGLAYSTCDELDDHHSCERVRLLTDDDRACPDPWRRRVACDQPEPPRGSISLAAHDLFVKLERTSPERALQACEPPAEPWRQFDRITAGRSCFREAKWEQMAGRSSPRHHAQSLVDACQLGWAPACVTLAEQVLEANADRDEPSSHREVYAGLLGVTRELISRGDAPRFHYAAYDESVFVDYDDLISDSRMVVDLLTVDLREHAEARRKLPTLTVLLLLGTEPRDVVGAYLVFEAECAEHPNPRMCQLLTELNELMGDPRCLPRSPPREACDAAPTTTPEAE